MVALLSLVSLVIQPLPAEAAVTASHSLIGSPSGKVLFESVLGNYIRNPVIKPSDYYHADPNAPTTTIRFGGAFQGQKITRFYNQLCHDNRAEKFCLDGKPNDPLTFADSIPEELFPGSRVSYGVFLRKANGDGKIDGDNGLASILFDDNVSAVSFNIICALERSDPSDNRYTSGAEVIAFARDGQQLAKLEIAPKPDPQYTTPPAPDPVSFRSTNGTDEIAGIQVIMHRSRQRTIASFNIDDLSFTKSSNQTTPQPNSAPTYNNNPLPDLTAGTTTNLPIVLNNFFTDPDGDPLTFSNAFGLPDGLTLANGQITGTPTAAAAAQTQPISFGVDVSDRHNPTVTQRLTIRVNAPSNSPPTRNPSFSLPNLTVGVPINPPIDVSNAFRDPDGDALTYSIDLIDLPASLAFDPTTNQITGIPRRAGTLNIPIQVDDRQNPVVTEQFPLTIDP